MEAKDARGNVLQKGDTVNITATITDMVEGAEGVYLSALTAIPHGDEGKRYSIPVVHCSQVTKA